jgi:hypothetical protein
MDAEGWFDDPSGRHQLRWWDGTAWTAYIADDGVVAVDDFLPPRLPTALVEPAPEPVPARPNALRRTWRGVRARPLWARISALLVVAIAVVAGIAASHADPKPLATVEVRGFAPATLAPTTRAPTTVAPTTVAPTTRPTAVPRAAAATSRPTVARPPRECDHNYTGCVPVALDVDCASGSGNGPAYLDHPVRVIGTDVYDLDRDRNRIACDDG